MLTISIEVVLGLLLAVVLMNLFKRHSEPASTPGSPAQPDLANLRPADARAGDVLSIAGAGDNMSDLDLTTDRHTSFLAGARQWFEVSGMYRDRRVAMRVENEEDVQVWLHNDARKLSLEDLGLSEQDLAEMDERQNPSDSFGFDNADWCWRQSAEARASRSDQSQPQTFYYWEFRQQNGGGLLAVRKPQSEPFTVTLFQQIPTADVTIYRRG
jgi:hypothetical protein